MNGEELRVRLSHRLEGAGVCREPAWVAAFQAIPREVFVPDAVVGELAQADDPERWLEAVYEDRAVITGWDEQGSTSSSSAPSIMAAMLDALRLEDGSRILEIGTGSGYNAALLCHRLGDASVTSVDNQAALITKARTRLRSIGYGPTLAVADGAGGYPDGAPYDRLIGTCYAWPIPQSWIRQVRPGGLVVAVVPCGAVSLLVGADGTASGRYHSHTFSFMNMRGYMPTFPDDADVEERTASRGDVRPWRYSSWILVAGHMAAFNLLASAHVPYEWYGLAPETNIYDIVSGSWVRFEPDAACVVQGGPRRLWDEIEALYEQWCRLGAPNRDRFGLTVYADGRHRIWVDDPESPVYWDVSGPGSGIAEQPASAAP